jgi:drug/metabolite transporter (DMT)-like permease
MALGGNLIDPVSFTAVRLVSGAVALALISLVVVKTEVAPTAAGNWGSGFALFAYAAAFSLAYLSLSTGTGALILFGAVQVTMLGAALNAGDRLSAAQWIGLAAAVSGLIYLVLPGLAAPDPVGALLMAGAGIAWGVYSIRGRGVSDPIAMTAGNFLRAAPISLIVVVVAFSSLHLELTGVLLALLSGVVTSGLGYVLWYKALRGLTTTQASVLQLLVPLLAALGGVLFLAEQVTVRLILAGALILGGVAVAVLKSRRQTADD